MKIISVNVGRPRLVTYNGQPISTAIYKAPVAGRIMLRTLNLDGDRQADLTVHGGVTKAVYAYPVEHYDYWRDQFPEMEQPPGMFGENLTIEGLSEATVNIGDRFRLGEAEIMVTEPRLPCYKLGIKFGRTDILRKFLNSGRTGFYFSVQQEGEVGAEDTIELIERNAANITVADVVRLYATDKTDIESLQRAVALEALPTGWRERFKKQLAQLNG